MTFDIAVGVNFYKDFIRIHLNVLSVCYEKIVPIIWLIIFI